MIAQWINTQILDKSISLNVKTGINHYWTIQRHYGLYLVHRKIIMILLGFWSGLRNHGIFRSDWLKCGFFKKLLHYECTSCQLNISSHQNLVGAVSKPNLHKNHWHGFHYQGFRLMYVQVGDFRVSRRLQSH